MPEVLTQVDPDDSIEKSKSERRAMRVQTSDSGLRFVDTRELMKGELAQGQHEDAGQVAAERTRLERLVIEAAKEWPANYEREELLTDSLALALFDATQALIGFESQIKK